VIVVYSVLFKRLDHISVLSHMTACLPVEQISFIISYSALLIRLILPKLFVACKTFPRTKVI